MSADRAADDDVVVVGFAHNNTNGFGLVFADRLDGAQCEEANERLRGVRDQTHGRTSPAQLPSDQILRPDRIANHQLLLLVDLLAMWVYDRSVTKAAPALVPLFRSEQQMRLLAEVFYGRPAAGAELARRTGIPQQTVARELARLEHAGLVSMEQIGTARLATPSTGLPYLGALRQLLAYAGGIVPALAAAYEPRPEVSEVFIFGSWARRFHGEEGPPPNDIDIVIVTDTLTSFDLAEARLSLESETGMAINQFVLPSDSDRLAELRNGSVLVFRRNP